MKSTRTLHVQTGQELSVALQENITAGNYTPWSGNCACSVVGNFHEEHRTYTYYTSSVGNLMEYMMSIYKGYKEGGLAGGLWSMGTGLPGLGDCFQQEITIHYYRKMVVTAINPLEHCVDSEWTS